MIILEVGGRQLVALKRMVKVAQKALKVIMELCTPHGPSFNRLIFDGMVGYGW